MRKAKAYTSPDKSKSGEMLSEYNLDYRKARPNRFAKRMRAHRIVLLDPDIADVFPAQESVNNALRALISAMPHPTKRKTAAR